MQRLKKRAMAVFGGVLSILTSLVGCTVPGEIGTASDFFEQGLTLSVYSYDESENLTESSLSGTGLVLSDLVSDTMDYRTYSAIVFNFKADARDKQVTTLTFEITSERSGTLNLVLATDDEIQIGLTRTLSAGKASSVVISAIVYPNSVTKLSFKNVCPDGTEQADYDGYSMPWRISYLQVVYEKRS